MSRSMLYSLALGALAMVVSASPASAQVAFSLEGVVNAVATDGLGGANVTVGSTVVNLRAATPVTGAAGAMTYANLLDPTPLPGRVEAGFVGSAINAAGTTTPAGVVTIGGTVDVQPIPSSILGVVTANTLATAGGIAS